MTTKKKIIIGVIALILVAIVVYFLFKDPIRNMLKPKVIAPDSSNAVPLINTTLTSVAANDNFPLQVGSVGPNVGVLQAALRKLSGGKISIDNKFGNETKTQVIAAGPNLYPVQKDDFDLILMYANSI
jgi:hypothetical protein